MIALNFPLVTWFVVAFAMIALIIVRVCHRNYNCNHRHCHLVEMGSEKEEFFITGDRTDKEEIYYDDDE